jgi:hypothetical protein
MSPRAIRRATERQSLKLAAKPSKVMLATVGSDEPNLLVEINPPSEARLLANRANSQFSTGPRTEAGKAKSSLNAVKTGLTGRTVLLPTDDASIYQHHLDRHFSQFSPATDQEQVLVQTIADTEWRLLRIVPLETGLYAIGRRKLADQFADEPDPTTREALIMAEVFTVYMKQLSNLALQERRLRNQRKADIAELQQLQQERAEKQHKAAQWRQQQVRRAGNMYNEANDRKRDFDPAAHGFDFSVDELFAYRKACNDENRPTEAEPDFDTFIAARRAAQKEPKAA